MRVSWVHPSWRDLVIESLAADPVERRRFLSRCFNAMTAWMTGVRLHDVNCGLKAYRAEVPDDE